MLKVLYSFSGSCYLAVWWQQILGFAIILCQLVHIVLPVVLIFYHWMSIRVDFVDAMDLMSFSEHWITCFFFLICLSFGNLLLTDFVDGMGQIQMSFGEHWDHLVLFICLLLDLAFCGFCRCYGPMSFSEQWYPLFLFIFLLLKLTACSFCQCYGSNVV